MLLEEGVRSEPALKSGLSGAEIFLEGDRATKVSIAYNQILAQAQRCKELYPITPFIHGVFCGDPADGNFYIMERLSEPSDTSQIGVLKMLTDMRTMLSRMVWSLRISQGIQNWRFGLFRFMAAHGYDVGKLIEELFPIDGVLQSCEIHGDATLSNVMYRKNRMCLIDPIPLDHKIAPHWTVDIGKMLQSGLGWERVNHGWDYNTTACIARIFDDMRDSESTQKRAWFWCMVHCVRIIPYAAGRADLSAWASVRATVIYNQLRSKSCSTHSILTELS